MRLRNGNGMTDAAERVVAAIAATGGDDKVVFATRNRIVEPDPGDDGVAFEDYRPLDELRLVGSASVSLLQPEALLRLGDVNRNVMSRDADDVPRHDLVLDPRLEVKGIVNANEPPGQGVDRLDPLPHRLTVGVPRLDRTLRIHAIGFGIDVPRRERGGKRRIKRSKAQIDLPALGDRLLDEVLEGLHRVCRLKLAVPAECGELCDEFITRKLAAQLEAGLKPVSRLFRRRDIAGNDLQFGADFIRTHMLARQIGQGE